MFLVQRVLKIIFEKHFLTPGIRVCTRAAERLGRLRWPQSAQLQLKLAMKELYRPQKQQNSPQEEQNRI